MMPVFIIGIMSGSSLDGLDMALCCFDEVNGKFVWDIMKAQTISFPEPIILTLKDAPNTSGFDLMKLDADFGKYIGIEIRKWVSDYNLYADYIASHGHTVFHEPAKGFTTQIGSGAHIAFETGIDTITSFRNADIAAGGQGAPFAPAADKNLFQGYSAWLNLGGIANISILTENGQWHAWDIGPCNQTLNALSQLAGKPYDEDGTLASTGKINESIVRSLLEMFPFNEGKPFGLSNAIVQSTWIKYLLASKEQPADLLASVSEAIARLVLVHLTAFLIKNATVLVTGGGSHNLYLMDRIKSLSKTFDISIELPSKQIIDYKECLLMAYLGYLTIEGISYGISDVTGAEADTIGGALFKAQR
jgi:anhydro-N-acetylmuramic acid kinase